MNRFFTLLLFLSSHYLHVKAQPPVTRPNKAANPAPSARIISDLTDSANENRLVFFALRGPEFDASIHQNTINELELKRAKTTWLNLLSISTNYNDQSFAKQSGPAATYVYPKYYFGISIPLGIFISQGNLVKTARESIANGKDQQEILSKTIKANILSKYKQYKLYTTLLEMESELLNDVLTNSSQAEDNFKKGSITVEIYIAAQKTKNEELVKILNLQLQKDLIRIDMERMIGVPLDQVLRPVPASNPLNK